MAGQDTFDLNAKPLKTTKGPRNTVRLEADVNGLLYQSVKGAPYSQIGGVSGDVKDMFKARAQAFLPPGFHSVWVDYYGPAGDVFTSGFAPTSAAAAVNTGRCGGARNRVTSSGATGFHYETMGANLAGAALAPLCANHVWDPWYVETGVVVNAITGSGELGLCGVYKLVDGIANTDAASGSYFDLAIRLAISATNLVQVSQIGGVLTTTVTTIPIELGVYRIYSLGNDGAGRLWWYRDGVPFTVVGAGIPSTILPFAGSFFRYERANGGTTDLTIDYWSAASVSN